MSAFVVGKAHIDAMLRSGMPRHGDALHWLVPGENPATQWKQLDHHTADAVGQMLLDECVRSVGHRYEDDTIASLPGPSNAEWLLPYRFSPFGKGCPTAVEAIKLISCYTYQSCEHPEWEASEAKAFCDALTHTLITRLPGYEEAPWEWTEKRPNSPPVRIV